MNFSRLSFLTIGLMLQSALNVGHADGVLSSHLQRLQAEFRIHTATKPASTFSTGNGSVGLFRHQFVAVDITLKSEEQAPDVMKRLEAAGMTQMAHYKKLVSGVFPIGQLDLLNSQPEISWVSSNKATRRELGPPGGLAYNAADPAMFTDVVRKQYNVDGSGLTIGVLSDSYDCQGGAQDDISSGDLPADVIVLKEYPFCEEGAGDEGRAMMQLIHDVAPGAKLMFYSAFVSAVDFAQGIQELADAGAKIIVDDVGYFAMPMFQEGPIAQSINEVKARGISYFSAAGNDARLSYESPYMPGKELISADDAHDFGKAAGGSSDYYQKITLPPNQPVVITMQWDDPAEIAGGEGAKTDLDLFLLDPFKRRIVTSSQDTNIGHNPVEIISGFHTFDTTDFYLYISHRAGPAPTYVKYIIHGPVAPWPEATADEIIELDVAIDNGVPNLVFPDGTTLTGGIAVILSPDGIIEIGTEDYPILVGTGGKPLIRFGDRVYEIGPGTGYPIYFIPNGFSYALGPNGIELYKEKSDFIPVSIDQYATYSSSIVGHPNASGAIAVGAMPYYETPWFGSPINRGRIEYFSSAGGTPLFFRPDGTRLPDKEVRFKPDLVAPDNVDTTFFGADSDANGLPNFAGTSAAAPHAAALAALLSEAFPYLSPDGIYLAMTRGSLDLLDPAKVEESAPHNPACADNTNFDWATGCGLVQADLAFDVVSNAADNVYLSLTTSVPTLNAGVEFEYQFKLMNFSGRDLENVRIRALTLPKNIRSSGIDGCIDLDGAELSCRLGTVKAGEIRFVTLNAMPVNNPEGKLVFEADVLTPSPIDLSKAFVSLTSPFQKLTGDLNHDGCVDTSDWGMLFGLLRTGSTLPEYDLTGDGVIGLDDLTALENAYSRPAGGACS